MRHLFLGLILFFCFGCAPYITTDLKTYLAHPQEYAGKRVILKTTLAELAQDPQPYLGHRVEVTGEATCLGYWGFWTWNFWLKSDQEKIRCYEDNYRNWEWDYASSAVKRAETRKDPITVVGKLRQGFEGLEIELDWIKYGHEVIDTDYVPPQFRLPTFTRFSPEPNLPQPRMG